MFSKTCEYGMRAIFFVAQQADLQKKVGVKAIAEAIESPEAFTAKIMQQLTKKGFVNSLKGPYGGFFIEPKELKEIKMNKIINLFDGEKAYKGCILGLKNCDENKPCPLHYEAEHILTELKILLENKSLYDILYDKNQLKTFWLKT